MKSIACAALSLAFATGSAACSEEGPSGPGDTGAPGAPATPRQIAYLDVYSGLTLMNVDGSGSVRLGSGWSPAWSPDGLRLAFSTTQCDTDYETYYRCDRGGLVIMNLGTREVATPVSGAFGEEPAWSPTGDRIAFVRHTARGRRLFLMRVDGSELGEIVVPEAMITPFTEFFRPSWSPDGRRIAFQCWLAPFPGFGICAINSDGTGLTRVATAGLSPAWSPDGTRIAFTGLTGGTPHISVMAADGSAVTRLADGLAAAWSSDGKTLAFSRNNDGLFAMNADGSGVKRLTTGSHNTPAWRPQH